MFRWRWLLIGAGVTAVLAIIVWLVILSINRKEEPLLPTPLPRPALNPQHGIHATIGYRWDDNDRLAMAAFLDKVGFIRAPGSVLALSTDMEAATNSKSISLEQDLFSYQAQGSQIYVRMYPQRFPGGISEAPNSSFNTVSGTAQDAVEDIFKFLRAQQQRTGKHLTRIIPGNEMNIEWANGNYYYNLLRWRSNDDPLKYDYINAYFLEMFSAWEERLKLPENVIFRDVQLFFPALSQDGNPDYFGGYYFYDNGQPIASKLDRLRPAIERFGRFTWHNYWRPGKVWEDRAIVHFPAWLKNGIDTGLTAGAITECGWSPQSMSIAIPEEQRILEILRSFPPLNMPIPAHTYNYDDTVDGARFEDDLRRFGLEASGASGKEPKPAPAIMVWLAGSGGVFQEAVGVTKTGEVRRWLRAYAGFRL